jgi:hypothetical protein
MAMNVNSCDLTKPGRKPSSLNDTGYLLTCLGINHRGYYITLQMTAKGAGNWSANTTTYLV